jgi:exopolysaccharide production protein ExoQ
MIYIAAVTYMVLPTEVLSFVDRMIYGEWPGKPGDKITQLLNLLAIASSVFLFWLGTRGRRSQLNRALPLAAAGLLAISVLWSVTPGTTMTRSIAYFFLVVGANGIAEIFDADEVMRLTALIGGFSAAISLVLPDAAYAISGNFRGAFPGKNQLGAAMVIGVLGGLHCMQVARRRRFIYIGITVLCTIVAFLSKSGTSLITILALYIFNLIGRFYIKGGISRILSMFAALLVTGSLILLMLNMDLIYSLLDKDPTLSGRADFWPYIIDYVYQRPILGWGFAAFWMESNPAAAEIFSTIGFFINEAHNGLLQLLLDVGVVGTAVFLFLWMRNVVMAVKCIHGPAPAIGVSSLAFLIGVLLMGMTEQVLTTADVWTAQFFMLGFMCEKQLGLARQARSAIALRPAAPYVGQFAGSREGDAV